ncbi:bifunctional riboflavin kinase/FAD synthetase [Lacisediminihabitans profunda]|uniref:Riboflavin biosynthesis protein n=1 Tax=Lacisediminihabitans profunda TaxID=2594790 RepID=A0A5C8UW13_9MICO|nr:bifunctional riboflavin kinase/FAD synthetase [Lacisediminihabitans profunda]TXN32801.1 bifunctional riboflavin kinase/FAD synthetase [Lacisediminihabitans profunda]
MKFFSSLAEVPADFGPSAVTIGKFDGVHAGHRSVIARLRQEAAQAGLVSTVLTFDRHPLALLRPDKCPESLTSNDQKRAVLETTGVDAVVMIEFTEAFSLKTPEDFVLDVLVNALHARLVFVGPDFRFGHRGLGTVELLERLGLSHGFEVRVIEAVRPYGDRVISSTWIRGLLAEGRVGEAAALLERRPTVRGIVVPGERRGRALGYPTANLSRSVEGFVPADGVYAAYATVDGRTMPAAVSIGNNPTFVGVPDKQIEAHLLDEDLDLYGKTVEIAFVEYIRGMEKFASVDDLVVQMTADEARVRQLLEMPARSAPIGPRA